jgi:predicted ATPase with chaperone activity
VSDFPGAGDESKSTPISRYRKRISGPLIDHIDLHLDVPRIEYEKLAVQQLQLSARAYHRVLKLARTIADLSFQDHIQTSHLAEALQYRPREWG